MARLNEEAAALLERIDNDPRIQALQLVTRLKDARRVTVTMKDGREFTAERTESPA